MTIKNKTKRTILTTDATFFGTEKERMKGLIGQKNPKTIFFETRFGIHTFFMKFSIDVLILDTDKKVVKLISELKPNRIFIWNPIYKIVIELPEGTIKKSRTTIDDMLQYES